MSLLVLFPSGPAGTTYPQTFTETWQASESLPTKLTLRFSISETWVASETLATVKRFKSALTEAWQATEAFATQFVVGTITGGVGLIRRIFTKQS